MKALVTGCAGFIGSHLTERLLGDGFDVIGIDCFTDYYPREYKDKNIKNSLEDDAFTLIEQDILSLDAFPDVDYVFHQAAQAGVRKSWGRDFEIYTRDNILATQRLLEYYKDCEIKKFVYASSSSVYGDGEQTRDFTFVDDIVEANVLAAMSGSRGEVFNVGGGTRISVNELLEIMENVTGRRAVVKYIETQKGDVKDTLADAGKIGELGWKPRVGIEEGVRRFVGWYGSVSLKC